VLPVGDEVVVDDVTMRRALEAILMVTDEPLPVLTLARAIGRPTGDIAGALAELAAEYTEQGRGFDLREVGGGWRYYTRADSAQYVERFVLDGQQSRITQAALETLAVVAYKQPVSRARVSAIRGVNVDGVMRTLVARGLVEEAGADTESQATLYRTSTYFLERMGMQSLDDLPELAPYLPEMDDIEEELAAQSLPPTSNPEGDQPANTADSPALLPTEADAEEPTDTSNLPEAATPEPLGGVSQQQSTADDNSTDNNSTDNNSRDNNSEDVEDDDSSDDADDKSTDENEDEPARTSDSPEGAVSEAEKFGAEDNDLTNNDLTNNDSTNNDSADVEDDSTNDNSTDDDSDVEDVEDDFTDDGAEDGSSDDGAEAGSTDAGDVEDDFTGAGDVGDGSTGAGGVEGGSVGDGEGEVGGGGVESSAGDGASGWGGDGVRDGG
jgi:segregation and condensation protein B